MPKVIERPKLTLAERLYVVEIFKGLALTIKHAFTSVSKAEELWFLITPVKPIPPGLPFAAPADETS